MPVIDRRGFLGIVGLGGAAAVFPAVTKESVAAVAPVPPMVVGTGRSGLTMSMSMAPLPAGTLRGDAVIPRVHHPGAQPCAHCLYAPMRERADRRRDERG